jgi:hypothetical protein
MLQYNPGAFRPAVVISPTMRRQAPGSFLGQRFDQLLDWGPVAGDILRLIAHGMAGYLGYYVWLTAPKKSFPRYFGLAMGLVQTFGALCDVISLGQRAAGTHPPETECPPSIPLTK